MRRGAKPAKAKVEARLPAARKSRTNESSRVRDLEKRLATAQKRETEALERLQTRDRELVEARQQQTATAEILAVISRSPTDVQPVFDAIIGNAVRLCGALYGMVWRYEGGLLDLVGHQNLPPEELEAIRRVSPRPLAPGAVLGPPLLEGAVLHIPDVERYSTAEPDSTAMATVRERWRVRGVRSALYVPMRRESEVVGAIGVSHPDVGAFSPSRVALLRSFADQAVIAIENVRLFTELQARNRELTTALDKQTATSEILRVISRSPTDVQPVFDAILASAVRLLGAHHGALTRVVGDQIELTASTFIAGAEDPALRAAAAEGSHAQVIRERAPVSIADMQTDPRVSEGRRALARARGYRSLVTVPLLRQDEALGAIAVARREAGGFSNDEIALLQTFADQAVIAIENVRLFNETKEALERQTATGEILRVIARSPTDVQPVFDAIVGTGARLCEADFAMLARYDGASMSVAAHSGATDEEIDAVGQVYPMGPTPETLGGRTILERAVVHIPDVSRDPTYGPRVIKDAGWRTGLGIPLLREGAPIGAVGMWRRDVRPFTDRQIELLKTFADQAVIAIENVRLFKELEARNRDLTTALDRQTATSEILRVISSSPTDVQPVFDTIVQSAARLCHAANAGVFLTDGRTLDLPANYGSSSPEALAAIRAQYPRPVDQETTAGVAILTRSVIHVPDIEAPSPAEVYTRRVGRLLGVRSMVAVPMMRKGEVVGAINLSRQEPGRFSDSEVELLKTFADQAVIAIENVRLFKELEARNRDLTDALDRQTATADILRVISQAPADVQPVFDTIVDSAVCLCRARFAVLLRITGRCLELAAHSKNVTAEWVDMARQRYPVPLSETAVAGVAILERRAVHVPDLEQETRFAFAQELARTMDYRSIVFVPMLREDTPIGAIGVAGNEPFTDGEIELLKTFADQAVIAIENVRLFTELQTSNRDLTTALEKQTATSEILRVISQSQTDVQPVFDAILGSALRLLGGYSGGLTRIEGDQIVLVALSSTDPVGDSAQRALYPQRLHSETTHAQAIRNRAPVNIADAQEDPRSAAARARGFRSVVAVPLLRHDEPLGAMTVTRREAGGFTDDEIALLETFADQAVIAIENARLLGELQARTTALTRSVGELTALGEVSRALSSTLDLETVLQTIVTRASQLAEADACSVFEYDDATEAFHLRATNNLDEEVVALARRTPTRRGEGVQGRMAVTRQPVQVPDIAQEDAYRGPLRDILLRTGTRAVLAIPMLREDHLIGGLTVNKKTPGEFSPDVIELLKTFATQSALAIQNARLFREIADKSRQLEVASRHKSEFLANMSHELRTPLNAIIGFSEVLAEGMFGEVNEKQTEYLRDILESGQHLLSLINDILDLSKIEAGRMDLELTDFDLPQAILNALTLVRERAGRLGIALHHALDQGLGQVRGDERKIKQVLLNLLSNALKFTPEGGRVDVRASVVDGLAEISVTDTGVGIAPEDQEAVFEEFRQVGTAAKKVEGTGLGLALSRKFIELHGGRIWVKSQVGMGSTFTFTIPVRRGA